MMRSPIRGSHGWAEIDRARKREIIDAIVTNRPTQGPVHVELDLTDRCNVDCYFCNQQDLRTKEQIPVQTAIELIDELAGAGLRSVRLSGGGDPLFHRQILDVLDHLRERNVVVDNVTTNAVALGPEIARRLIDHRAREVVVSLNTWNAADYHRMMQVKPALFQKVVDNVEALIEARGDSIYPSVIVQFLLDRENYDHLPEMAELGRSMGADRIAINAVLGIPRERIEKDRLLRPEDRELVRPLVERVLVQDRDEGRLQIDFAISGWNEMLREIRETTGAPEANLYPTASSFSDENQGCFFAWYTAAVTGNGDVRPCCLLLDPDYPRLGNVHQQKLLDQWRGPVFQRMRDEMREVLVMRGKARYHPGRFRILDERCVKPNLCWLKNMYFRADEEFYRELGEALEGVRRRELRWLGSPRQFAQKAEMLAWNHPSFRFLWDQIRDRTRVLRHWLRSRFGLRLGHS